MNRMIRVYISTNKPREEYLSAFKGKIEFADNLSQCDKMLLFLDSDTRKAKQDINYALDKKKPVVYITSDDFRPDKGLEMQLGLETGFTDKDNTEKVLEALLKENPAPVNNKKKPVAALVVLLIVLIICAVIIVPKLSEKTNSEPETQTLDTVEANKPQIIEMEENLLIALKENSLDTDGNGFISRDELINVTELNLSGKGIADITGLVYAENLKVLDLSDNNISDIKALVSLKQLEELNIKGNPISDYSYLDYISSIKKITSDSNKKY